MIFGFFIEIILIFFFNFDDFVRIFFVIFNR